MKQHIELRKLRDFGQVFNDTFVFFKDNLKPLLRSLFVICGLLIAISAISTAATFLNVSSIASFTPMQNTYSMESHTVSMLTSAVVTIIVLMITQSCISLVTLCYISVYLQNKKQEPELIQVWGYFKYYFWRVIGATLLLGLLAGIGCLFCVLPGIYLAVVFSMVIPVIIMENASFGYAFNKSFSLIRNNWWFVFGVIIVVWLIIFVAYKIAGIPLSLVALTSKLLTTKSLITPLLIFFSIMQNLLIVTHSLLTIAIALCYFDLSEQKEAIGLLSRIENFGKPNDEETHDPHLAEDY